MARSAGRYSQFYVSITSGGSAAALSHAGSYDVNLATDKLEVTAFGDTTKQYVSGLPDGQFSVSGFASDTAATSLVSAALDGVARKYYIYPFASTGIYFFGTAFFDWQTQTEVNGTVNFSSSAAPATAIGTVGF
jgi:hypothetical protein